MSLDVLYVSVGQRFGPEQVAINLLKNILPLRDFVIYGVVDSNVSNALSLENQKCVKTVKNPLELILILFIVSLKNKPKICHFNFPPLLPAYMPVLLLMKILGIKIVYSFHGGILLENKRMWAKTLFIIQCKHLYEVIIANSKYSAQFLLQAENRLERKLVIIPNGIKVEDQINSATRTIRGQPAVLYVGRIDYVKGVDILVNAIALVKKKLPKICLHVVGDGTKLGEIKELVSFLEVERSVVLHGFVTEKEKNSMYLACDMVVVPSRNEPFGITVLEAMRAGKPLIVSNRGALPELVRNNCNGLVVKLRPDALAQAILSLNHDKNLRTRISKYNKIAVKSYDWKKISKVYLQLYRTVL